MMKLFTKSKDGGPDSPVDAFFLVENKKLFSIAILKFNVGRREAFHTHAFDAYTWFLFGDLIEEDISGEQKRYTFGFLPKITLKNKNHRVLANKDSWCFTIRGPWGKYWKEYNPETKKEIVLTHGRKKVIFE